MTDKIVAGESRRWTINPSDSHTVTNVAPFAVRILLDKDGSTRLWERPWYDNNTEPVPEPHVFEAGDVVELPGGELATVIRKARRTKGRRTIDFYYAIRQMNRSSDKWIHGQELKPIHRQVPVVSHELIAIRDERRNCDNYAKVVYGRLVTHISHKGKDHVVPIATIGNEL